MHRRGQRALEGLASGDVTPGGGVWAKAALAELSANPRASAIRVMERDTPTPAISA